MRSCGQCRTVSQTISMASRGEGGSCGHHQVTVGCRWRTTSAILCALNERGEERKPCKYKRCDMFILLMVDGRLFRIAEPSRDKPNSYPGAEVGRTRKHREVARRRLGRAGEKKHDDDARADAGR